MKVTLFATVSAVAICCSPAAAYAQAVQTDENGGKRGEPEAQTETVEDLSPAAEAGSSASQTANNTIIVTATRRETSLQDVPLSITAFQQEELSRKGIVGYESLARETPGIVINKPTQNFNNFTARGISTNGYSAGLQGSVAIYIDELPISANGNSTIIDPTLYDVERVEFLRGPQGTLFGSSSLAGAMRIITNNPDSSMLEASALIDLGMTGSDSLRQRYNGMINVPIVEDKLALRAVGFYRHEEGWVDNVGTGIENANTLESVGGRVALQWEPTDRLSMKAMVVYENSKPEDSGLINPNRGDYVRLSNRPDLFQGELTSYNLSLDYEFDFADLTSSTTYATYDQLFVVDLAGTFGQAIPFGLDAFAFDDTFVQEVRLASSAGGPFEWIVGGYYNHRRRDTDLLYRSSLEFLQQRNFSGLSDEYYQKLYNYTVYEEIAGFGELTYRFGEDFWVTGGLRYTDFQVQSFQEAGGYSTTYLAQALGGLSNVALDPLPYEALDGAPASAGKVSWKASASYKPTSDMTFYATVATGFRPPVANARAGLASVVDPGDIVIPEGAVSDNLINYEVGLKGSFFDRKLTANLAAYYIDWKDIQVQANRVSDAVQFATNIGGAVSKGIEFELAAYPVKGLSIFLNGSVNDTEVNDLTPAEAAISGAEEGIQLAFPSFQGSATIRADFTDNAYFSASASHVGSFPGLFPNVPGQPGVQSPQYAFTDDYTVLNLYLGVELGDVIVTGYIENFFDDDSITYVHPEAFFDSRFAKVRPRTVGVRASIQF